MQLNGRRETFIRAIIDLAKRRKMANFLAGRKSPSPASAIQEDDAIAAAENASSPFRTCVK